MSLVSSQICRILEFKKVSIIKLGTASLQSRFKFVQKLVKKFSTISGYFSSYLEKLIDYFETFRAPPLETVSYKN